MCKQKNADPIPMSRTRKRRTDVRLSCRLVPHAQRPFDRGVDIRSVQLLLGHESLETTMIYTHVARKGVSGIISPLDVLADLGPESIRAAIEGTLRVRDQAAR